YAEVRIPPPQPASPVSTAQMCSPLETARYRGSPDLIFGNDKCGWAHLHLLTVGQADGRVKDHLLAVMHAVVHLDGVAEVAHLGDAAQMGNAVLDHGDAQPVLVENDRCRRHDQRWRLAWNLEVNQA